MSDEDNQNHVLAEMYRSARYYNRMYAAIHWGGVALTAASVLTLAFRAHDYLAQPPPYNDALSFLSVLGFQFWGHCFMYLAIIMGSAQIAILASKKFYWALFLVTGLTVSTYCAYFVAVLQSLVTTGGMGGWRTIATVAAAIISSLVRVSLLNAERNS